jgi:hypothetical protein
MGAQYDLGNGSPGCLVTPVLTLIPLPLAHCKGEPRTKPPAVYRRRPGRSAQLLSLAPKDKYPYCLHQGRNRSLATVGFSAEVTGGLAKSEQH